MARQGGLDWRKGGRQKAKSPTRSLEGLRLIISLTITYFHTGCSTIIGAKSFHGPVRDGKGWYQLAMVIRHDLSVPWRALCAVRQPKLEEVFRIACYCSLMAAAINESVM